MKALVSVVITTYKRSNKIEDAIKSVLNQTYRNIEIIVVDDNANNLEERKKTEKIVNKYNNINYIQNKENIGGALSRNVGIKASKGDYISFLDDDDMYFPERIQKMVVAYEKFDKSKSANIGLVYCNCDIINENKKIIGSYVNNYSGNPIYQQMMGCIAGTSMWLTKKRILEKIGMFEDTPCKQDSIVLLKLLVNGYNVYSINENLVYYYEHNGNGISGIKQSNIDGLINYRDWCRKYYKMLNSINERKNVECNFSSKLVSLYILNNQMENAKKELKNMLKMKPFSIGTIKSLLKYCFPKLYLKKIGICHYEKK